MAQATIARTDTGLYEQPLTANTPLTIQVQQRFDWETMTFQIINHGTSNVYAKTAATLALKDTGATLIAPSGWANLYVTSQLTLISSADTTVSIVRQ